MKKNNIDYSKYTHTRTRDNTIDNKKDYKTIIYGNPKDILNEIKFKVKPLTYNKIENLYIKFKDKIDMFTKNIREG